MSGKCPNCGKPITHLKGTDVKIKHDEASWSGTMFLCPRCDVVLGAGIDPTRICNDTLARLSLQLDRLKRKP